MNEIKIGNQIWMAENLDVGTFRNGDPIPEAKTKEEWLEAGKRKEPAWCYYNNDSSMGELYGRFYNWFAIMDFREISFDGWKVPTDDDWFELITFAGGMQVAGSELKSRTYD